MRNLSITNHARDRIGERTGITRKRERDKLSQQARRRGLAPDYFYGNFRSFLFSKAYQKGHVKIKVYKECIFVYRGKNLLTMYPVPEVFKPTSKYRKCKRSTLP